MRTKTVFFMATCLTLSLVQLTGCDAIEGMLGQGDEKEGEEDEGDDDAEDDEAESDEINPKDMVSASGICAKYTAKTEDDEEWATYLAEQEEGRGDCEEYLTKVSTDWDTSNPALKGQFLGIHDWCLDKTTTYSEFEACFGDALDNLLEASKRHKEGEASEDGAAKDSGPRKARRANRTGVPPSKGSPRRGSPVKRK